MTCCSDNDNPADFTIYQGLTFGPTEDNLADPIYFNVLFEVDGVKTIADLTGYLAKMTMKPEGGGDDIVLSSATLAPLSRLIVDASEGSIAPFFSYADNFATGRYGFDITIQKDEGPIFVVCGTITVKEPGEAC